MDSGFNRLELVSEDEHSKRQSCKCISNYFYRILEPNLRYYYNFKFNLISICLKEKQVWQCITCVHNSITLHMQHQRYNVFAYIYVLKKKNSNVFLSFVTLNMVLWLPKDILLWNKVMFFTKNCFRGCYGIWLFKFQIQIESSDTKQQLLQCNCNCAWWRDNKHLPSRDQCKGSEGQRDGR